MDPVNDFEAEFRRAMEESGMTWNSTHVAQILPNAEIENHRERSQIARVRTLLRAEQIRNRRLKNIKSKSHRRLIRKKELKGVNDLIAKLDKEDPNGSEEIRAELEKKLSALRLNRQRQARLKWSQAAQRFGGREIRTEVSRQAQADQDEYRELVRAVKGKNAVGKDSNSSDSDSDSDEFDGSDDDIVAKVKRAIDKKVLGLESTSDSTKGLMGMKFMQTAAQKQKSQTIAEAQEFLEALSNSSQSSSDDEEEGEIVSSTPVATDIAQQDLVASLFSAPVPTASSEQKASKKSYTLNSATDDPDMVPGWGSWVGEGVRERKKRVIKSEEKPVSSKPSTVMHVAGDDVLKAPLMKYQVKDIPYPYQSRSEYEAAMARPLGPEWQTLSAHAETVKPAIAARLGSAVPRLTHCKNLESDKRAKIINAWDTRKRTQHTKAKFL